MVTKCELLSLTFLLALLVDILQHFLFSLCLFSILISVWTHGLSFNPVIIVYFFYFCCAVSLLLCGLFSSCSEQGLLSHCDVWASHCSGNSCGASALVYVGFSSCGSQALERRLSSCGTWAWLLLGMWDLPEPGIEHMSPSLAGRFFTTEPPGKPLSFLI